MIVFPIGQVVHLAPGTATAVPTPSAQCAISGIVYVNGQPYTYTFGGSCDEAQTLAANEPPFPSPATTPTPPSVQTTTECTVTYTVYEQGQIDSVTYGGSCAQANALAAASFTPTAVHQIQSTFVGG